MGTIKEWRIAALQFLEMSKRARETQYETFKESLVDAYLDHWSPDPSERMEH